MQQRASKREALEFIKLKGMIEVWQLRDKFGYTDQTARDKLSKLKKQGLVTNMSRTRWELTEKGFARLSYYAKRDRG